MQYLIRSECLSEEIKAQISNGTIHLPDSLEYAFETDADDPGLLYALVNGERIPMKAGVGSDNSISISLRGYTYPLQALSERDQYFQQLLKATATAFSGTVKVVAPMPGLIKAIAVHEGQQVKKGERLFILEAMKMENDLKASHTGIIAGLTASEGAAVDKNQLLCTIETSSSL